MSFAREHPKLRAKPGYDLDRGVLFDGPGYGRGILQNQHVRVEYLVTEGNVIPTRQLEKLRVTTALPAGYGSKGLSNVTGVKGQITTSLEGVWKRLFTLLTVACSSPIQGGHLVAIPFGGRAADYLQGTAGDGLLEIDPIFSLFMEWADKVIPCGDNGAETVGDLGTEPFSVKVSHLAGSFYDDWEEMSVNGRQVIADAMMDSVPQTVEELVLHVVCTCVGRYFHQVWGGQPQTLTWDRPVISVEIVDVKT